MNALIETIGYLNARLSVPVSSDVPTERPEAFVAIERTSGEEGLVSTPILTVQAWDADRLELEGLQSELVGALLRMPEEVDGVSRVEVSSTYYPETANGPLWPRYVSTARLWCRPSFE